MSNSFIPKDQINIRIDLRQGWLNKKNIVLKQSDHLSRVFVVKVSNNHLFNLTGYQAYLYFRRADGTIIGKTCSLLNATQGELMCKLSTDDLSIVGETQVEVVISKATDGALSFPHFSFMVEESFYKEEAVTDEEMKLVWDVINEARDEIKKVGEEYKAFEGELKNEFDENEQKRQDNETVRIEAENDRQATFEEMKEKVDKVYDSTITLSYVVVE